MEPDPGQRTQLTLDAILLGGGSGTRFSRQAHQSSALPKQFQLLGNAPVFIHAVRSFLELKCFRQIVLTVPKQLVEHAQEQLDAYLPPQPDTVIRVITGGERRQDSSCLALEAVEALSPAPDRVLIHDACRPYLSRDFMARVKERLLERSYGAWVPVVPVVDTLKKIDKERVVETIDRQLIHRVQTPQVFEYNVIRSLVEKAKNLPDMNFTDDASLCEYYGIPVGVFEGDVKNIKLTYEFELETLRSMIEEREKAAACESGSGSIYTA